MPENVEIAEVRRRSRSVSRRRSNLPSIGDGGEGFNTWAITLNEEKKEHIWSCKEEDQANGNGKSDESSVDDKDFMDNMLCLKTVALGAGAAKGTSHIVEVETKDVDCKPVKFVLANLELGVLPTIISNMDFTDKNAVTFRLVQGSGPVSISGYQVSEYPSSVGDMFDESQLTGGEEEEDSEEVEEEEEIEEEEIKAKAGVKRKNSAAKSAPESKAKQRSKKEAKKEESEEEEEDDEEEDEDDEDYEEEMEISSKKLKKATPSKAGKPKVNKPASKVEKKAVKKTKAK